MVSSERYMMFRDGSDNLNSHTQEFKSRSNDNRRKYFKHHNRDMGHVHKSQFKIFKEEDDEFAATLRKAELLDHNNCMWLSSDSPLSPSSCFQDNGVFCYTDLKIDAWFISLLSTPSTKSVEISSTKVTFFDGSKANPIEEASLVLDQRETLVFHENLEEEEVVSWLSTSIEDELSSVSSITESSDDQSLFSSCCSSEYSSEIVDLEEIGTDKPLFWPSDWTSDWDSETKWDLFVMSPRKDTYKLDSEKSCNRRLVFSTQSKSSTNFDLKNANGINGVTGTRKKPSRFIKTTKTRTKIVPLDNDADFGEITEAKVVNESEHLDTRTLTPVFWPSSCASEWGPDTKWDLFVMSPQKDIIYSFSESPKTSPDSMRVRVLNGNMDLEKCCSRRLEFSSCTKSDDERVEVKPLSTKSVRKHKIVLEDLLLVDKLNVEDAIEEVLGLDEFNGHEGLDSEFNENEFSLVESF